MRLIKARGGPYQIKSGMVRRGKLTGGEEFRYRVNLVPEFSSGPVNARISGCNISNGNVFWGWTCAWIGMPPGTWILHAHPSIGFEVRGDGWLFVFSQQQWPPSCVVFDLQQQHFSLPQALA